ncbi:peptidase S1 and S6 chymotrypsin/Hap [Calothrix brevissima NIES-22]|nr:peptidase S1 and S6 chymotrypsin/Hap [Calothrix brevissima NIES-22]
MNKGLLILTICLNFYLANFPEQILAENTTLTGANSCIAPELSTVQLHKYAKSITVKVFSGDAWGSGIVIHKQGQDYTVLTNDHVLISGQGKAYRIQTPDSQIYHAFVVETANFSGQDLALLRFRSQTKNYQVASLRNSGKLSVDNEVFAAGFPLESPNFLFTTGRIKLLLNQPLKGGLQIGYTNEIQKGMSGGPVLNRQGQVIGINARHAYPLWGNPYIFQNQEIPSKSLEEQMSALSWAVPIETFLKMAPKSIISQGCS